MNKYCTERVGALLGVTCVWIQVHAFGARAETRHRAVRLLKRMKHLRARVGSQGTWSAKMNMWPCALERGPS